MIALFVSLTDDDANTCLVILASAVIFCQITGQPDNWTVSVSPENIERAIVEIENYFQENRAPPMKRVTGAVFLIKFIPVSGRLWDFWPVIFS